MLSLKIYLILKKPSKQYTADFETTTDPNDCRVWAWSVCSIDDKYNKAYGCRIDEFINYISQLGNVTIYFHNLKFDSQFIISFLLGAGYKWTSQDKKTSLSFNTLINEMNIIYALEIVFSVKKYKDRTILHRVKIWDSLKKLPFPVSKIAKDFNLPISKLELDYTSFREREHTITLNEKEYLSNDVEIMARALKIQFEQGLTKMTIGSDALTSFKKIIGKSRFENLFPNIGNETDQILREAYRGGFTWVNPRFQELDIGNMLVYDVNSLYPWAMRYNPYPCGLPIEGDGKYTNDDYHPLYIQELYCEFKVKPEHIPCLQLKHNHLYGETEYISESKDITHLMLCDVDLDLFFQQYDVFNITYTRYWKFAQVDDIFNDYIDYWGGIKEKSKGAIRLLAKLMLNNLYGKFATSPHIIEKMPYLEDGVIKYRIADDYFNEPVYLPIGIWCTAYARRKTITTAQKVFSRFVYADTDSIHIIGTEQPKELDGIVDDNKLGYWANESKPVRARFLKAKSYVEEENSTNDKVDEMIAKGDNLYYYRDGKPYYLNVKCAGMPESAKQHVTFDNFHTGFTTTGKLIPRNVKGGVILEDTEFTIKPSKLLV